MASKLTRFSSAVSLVFLFGLSNLFSQTTLVNYDFNSGGTYAALTPALITNINSSANCTEAFTTFGGVATTAGAFTANSTAGNAIAMNNSSGTNTKYFTFSLSGSALANYKTLKLYFQAQRSGTGAQLVTVQYSLNGGAYTTFASNTMSPGNGGFNATTIVLPAAVDNPTSLDIRLFASAASSTGTLRMDNFQVQGVLSPLAASLTISNNGLQPNAASVFQNSNDHILQRFIVTEGNVAAGILNTVTVPLAGTYSASDIDALGLKLYAGTSNSFASAILLSSKTSASSGSGETVTFSSLNYAIAKNTARYFWVTTDIAAAAIAGKTINAAALNTSNFTFAAGTKAGSVNVGGVQTIAALVASLSITNNGTQPAAGAVLQNTNDNMLQRFIITEGNVAAGTLNSIDIPLVGTYLASDINGSGLKLYGGTANNFASATLLSSQASASPGSGETVTFNALNYAIAKNSAHYFWVTADIDALGVVGNDINAASLNAGNFSFAAGTVTVSVNAGGIQTIDAAAVTTQLRASYCGYTAQSFGEFIGADSVLTANHYRFELVNAANSYTQTFTNSSGYPYLALYLFPGMTYNTTYTVTVAWSADGVTFSPYGAPCTLTSPAAETTVLEPADCGAVYTGWNNLISAVPASGVTHYRFQLENAALSYTQTFTNVNKNFNFNSFTGLTGSTSYTASVAVELLGVWNPYGAGCTVTTPAAPTTLMLPQYCGYTPSSYTELMTAAPQVGTSFRFKLENVALGYSQTFTNVNRNVNLAQYPGLTAGTTYSISVSVLYNGSYGPYGPECTITVPAAPTTSMLPQYCGYTPSSYTELMTAEAQTGSGYKFKLENTALGYSQTFSNANRNVNLVQYTGLIAGTTYSISVSVLYNGIYGAYGNACEITVPSSAPTTSVVAANCGYTPATYRELMNVNAVTGATKYEYKLENASLGYSQTFTNVNRNFNFAVYTGLNTSTSYTISARVYFMGAWGPYGPACVVTTPSSSAMMLNPGTTVAAGNAVKRINGMEDQSNSFDAMAYPNPFNDRFGINLVSYTVNETVTIRVFDATGKLMEEHQAMPESLKDLNIGSAYAQGLYNIVISQGAQTKSIKVIKS
jgi:hypothetical protein